MTKEKTKIIIAVLVSFIVFNFLFAIQSKADVETEKEKFNYHLMVPLPTASGTVTEVEGITDYIKTIYLFAMGIAGVLAMALIVVGGFQWLTATGNTGTISQAKARINNALLGLAVLLLAYLLLNTINPALVNLKEPVLLFLDWTEEFGNAAGGGPGGGGGKEAWCFESDGKTPKITGCSQYHGLTGHGKDCLRDPCGIGPCYGDITSCGSCKNPDGTPIVTACQTNYTPMSGMPVIYGYDDKTSCESDTCGVGPCEWIRTFCSIPH